MNIYIYDSWFSFVYEIALYISDSIYSFFGSDFLFIASMFLMFVMLNVAVRYVTLTASTNGPGLREFFDNLMKKDLIYKLILGGVLFAITLLPVKVNVIYSGNKLIPADVINLAMKDLFTSLTSSSDSTGTSTSSKTTFADASFTSTHKLPWVIAISAYTIDEFLFGKYGILQNTMKPFYEKYKNDTSAIINSYIDFKKESDTVIQLTDGIFNKEVDVFKKIPTYYVETFNVFNNIKLKNSSSKIQKDIEKLIIILSGLQAGYTKETMAIIDKLINTDDISSVLNDPDVIKFYNTMIKTFNIELETEGDVTTIIRKKSTPYTANSSDAAGLTIDRQLFLSFLYNSLNQKNTGPDDIFFNTFYKSLALIYLTGLNNTTDNVLQTLKDKYETVIACVEKKETNCDAVTLDMNSFLKDIATTRYSNSSDDIVLKNITDEYEYLLLIINNNELLNIPFVSKLAAKLYTSLEKDISNFNDNYIVKLSQLRSKIANMDGAYNLSAVVTYIDSLLQFFNKSYSVYNDVLNNYKYYHDNALTLKSEEYFDDIINSGSIFKVMKLLDSDGLSLKGTAALIFRALAWFLSWAILIFSYLGLLYFLVIRAINFLVYVVLWFMYFFKAFILSDIRILKSLIIDWITFRAYDVALVVGIAFSYAFQILLYTLISYGQYLLTSNSARSVMVNLVLALCVFLNLQIMRFVYQNIGRIVAQSDNVFADSLKRVIDTGVAGVGAVTSVLGGVIGLSQTLGGLFGRESVVGKTVSKTSEVSQQNIASNPNVKEQVNTKDKLKRD
ncbi:hypothetical protein DEFDS_P049 (plasmid) [Deferribacter desulfuricans SSM1]|uniref:Uncharacterized protein n=1 Tax=Deferribacter desulfuricans (strain DSM 14783 / JCM 11476 / NBRC 101012 / SSM1) TaxID=639282 RepID=D3PEN1_DEFDS|nr:hypothetical protein [Deferribacter desulfuricans]BAI81673.1 hypothetical protein DEFDS_P049 [Deferribacter desulfuricans SSM1]